MTEKRFIFNSFIIEDMLGDKELKLYEIDNNPSDDLDESNLFYVYSTSDANVQSIVDKLNELSDENEQLKQTCQMVEGIYHCLQRKFHDWDIALSKLLQNEYDKCDIPVWRRQYIKKIAEKLGVDLNEL